MTTSMGYHTQGIDEVYLGRTFGIRLRRKARQIEAVAIDMSNAYAAWLSKVLPDAEIVYDHFHVIKLMNERMDALRRSTSATHAL